MVLPTTTIIDIPKRQELPNFLRILVVLIIAFSITTANPLVSIFAIIVGLVIFFQLWIPGQPPILFLCLIFQWLQSSTRILQANLSGLSLNVYDNSVNAESAIVVAQSSLLVFSLIAGRMIRNTRFNSSGFREYLNQVDLSRTFFVYIISLVTLPLLMRFAVGGLSQIIYSFQGLKWALYSLLLLGAFQQNRNRNLVWLAFTFELLTGFLGYFSSYRDVLLITAITLLTLRHRIHGSRFLLILLAGVLAFCLFVVWTGIKEDYRKFLRGGTIVGGQNVVVSNTEALTYLGSIIGQFKISDFEKNMDVALDRLQYTQMIQRCMDFVPSGIEHQYGKVWFGAITHIFTPRILFPNKEILDDSAVAEKYTGLDWSGAERGTSISIGYMAENYVDFGHVFFFLPMIFLGILFGRIYQYLLSVSDQSLVLNAGAIISMFMPFQLIELSGNKLLGGIIMNLLVYIFIIQRFIYPALLAYLFDKK